MTKAKRETWRRAFKIGDGGNKRPSSLGRTERKKSEKCFAKFNFIYRTSLSLLMPYFCKNYDSFWQKTFIFLCYLKHYLAISSPSSIQYYCPYICTISTCTQ